METTFLKTLEPEQKKIIETWMERLNELALEIQGFRLTDGDNHGCVDEAGRLASGAASQLEELLSRTQPKQRRSR